MISKKLHEKQSKLLFAKENLGGLVCDILDNKRDLNGLAGHHRVISHSWEMIDYIEKRFGEQGFLDAMLHIGLDYGLLKPIKNRQIKKRITKNKRIKNSKSKCFY